MMAGTLDSTGDTQTNEVYSYDPTTNTWTQHPNAPWGERFGTRVLVKPGTPDTIYVIGGGKGSGTNRIFYGDIWSTTDLENWTHEVNSTLNV